MVAGDDLLREKVREKVPMDPRGSESTVTSLGSVQWSLLAEKLRVPGTAEVGVLA